jgi:hypothetical protein
LVPQSSVNSQITRLNLTAVGDMVGKGIKFSRSTKMSRASKPFWNIDLATPEELKALSAQSTNGTSGASAAVPATGTSAGAAGVSAPTKSYTDIYGKATDFVLDKILPKYVAKGLAPTATDVHAMVATLFIPKSKES